MIRAAVVVVALVLGLAAVPVVGAANEISGETTCKDLRQAQVEPVPGKNCFAGSTQRRAVVVGLMMLAGAAALLAMIAGALVAIRGGRGFAFALLGLLAAGLFVAAYGAARV